MANKSFVIQYVIKAREQYSKAAEKVAKSSVVMNAAISKSKASISKFSTSSKIAISRLAIKAKEDLGRVGRTSKRTGEAFRRLKEKIKDSMTSAKGSFSKFAKSAKRNGAIASAAITVPILLMAKSLKNAARDAVETRSKFRTVFKDVAAESQKTADALATNFGLAGTESRKLLGDTGDLLSGFGFTGKEALKLSNQVNELAVDLASFTNFSGGAEGASAALTKALLGERESLKSLGIAILDKDVKAKISEMVAKGSRFESERQAVAYATLAIAVEQSKNAIGDYARTSGDLANQERLTAARVQDLKEQLGRELLPIALKITMAIREVTEKFSAMNPEMKRAILIVAGVVAIIGPLLLLFAGIGLAIPLITTGLAALGAVAAVVFSPIGLAVMALAAGAFLIIKNWDKVKEYFFKFGRHMHAQLVQPIIDMKNKVMSIINAIKNFDFSAISFDDIKAQFFGSETKPDLSGGSKIDVGLNVGLDKGLVQKEAPNVSTRRSRRGDVGFALAGA